MVPEPLIKEPCRMMLATAFLFEEHNPLRRNPERLQLVARCLLPRREDPEQYQPARITSVQEYLVEISRPPTVGRNVKAPVTAHNQGRLATGRCFIDDQHIRQPAQNRRMQQHGRR
jgi:hypothetical protein